MQPFVSIKVFQKHDHKLLNVVWVFVYLVGCAMLWSLVSLCAEGAVLRECKAYVIRPMLH